MPENPMRPALFAAGLLVLTACGNPSPATAGATPPLGDDLGSSARAPARIVVAAAAPPPLSVPSPSQPVRDPKEDARASGTVNSVDPAKRTINLSHEPIPAIGWPAMTMDFAVAPTVDLGAVRPGNRVTVGIAKGKGGIYEIQSVRPEAKGR